MPKKKSKAKTQLWNRWDRRIYHKHRKRSKHSQRDYNDIIYKEWRKNVYKRDGYKCQWPRCKCKEKRIYAHHILTWSEYPMKRFDVGNGITLCKYHHDKIKGQEEDYARMFFDLLFNKLRKKEDNG